MTYSIVARDPATGELGVAVQSHWFSVGGLVTWAQPGVGAVATQANVDPGYGPRTLDLLRAGAGAPDALAELVARDAQRDVRQVGVVDAAGRAAAHTGPACMDAAGHLVGDGVACQANIMASAEVWPAMAQAFAAAEGSNLAQRLLAALDAAEAAGGDLRGRQSAALLVVPPAGEPWDALVDLRVEDDPEPLEELRRLLVLADAYREAGEGDRLAGEGDHAAAARRYVAAYELAPGCIELEFWAGLALAGPGEEPERGLEHVRAAVRAHRGWGELLTRLGEDDAPAAPAVRRALGL
jgi:uncharacterized Ntn-hydrolase superfamily protein